MRNAAFLLLERKIPENYRNYRECLNGYFFDAETANVQEYDDDFPELRLPESFPDILEGYMHRPDFTHYIGGFQAALDHILMSSGAESGNKLRPLRQAEMPSLEQVTRHVAMPSPNFPSDHISVVCDIEWTTQTRQRE